jgi:hypothetical protein
MKYVVLVFIILIEAKNGHSQDSLKKNIILPIVREFSANNIRFKYYKQLPDFIRNYLDQMTRTKKFEITKAAQNDTYLAPGSKRTLRYALKSKDIYLLGYDHGGVGHHFHSIIFVTNGKEITTIYNLIVANTHQRVDVLTEHIEKGWYYIQEMKEY